MTTAPSLRLSCLLRKLDDAGFQTGTLTYRKLWEGAVEGRYPAYQRPEGGTSARPTCRRSQRSITYRASPAPSRARPSAFPLPPNLPGPCGARQGLARRVSASGLLSGNPLAFIPFEVSPPAGRPWEDAHAHELTCPSRGSFGTAAAHPRVAVMSARLPIRVTS